MLSPTNSLDPSPSRRSRRFPKNSLTVSPKIVTNVYRPSILTKQNSPEMKSEDQIIEESSTQIIKFTFISFRSYNQAIPTILQEKDNQKVHNNS